MKETLDEMLDWLRQNVGEVRLYTATWEHLRWRCCVEGKVGEGVRIKFIGASHDSPWEAVAEIKAKVAALSVNSRPLGQLLTQQGDTW